ncbi:MAG: alpha-xylosidase [Defluviitaleaceae bacterium]|nr:alpha-xylosidase [Defluviitaleaceae bacterium]MCL2239491.1 alpha-xylosidase [Defluviitaleaceae bacterium]
MKFTDGYWLMRPGNTAFSCTDIRDVRIEEKRVTLFVTPWKVYNRGQTLDGPLFTLYITAPGEGVLHIDAHHHMGGREMGPCFDLSFAPPALTVEEGAECIKITTGKLTATLHRHPFRIQYHWDGRFLTESEPRSLAYITTDGGPFWRERLLTSVEEKYYGFGERFTPFVKNGQVIDIWNEDGGTASEQAYKNIPFCLSNRGYGIFVNHPERVSYEVCSEAVGKMQFSVPGENLRYMVIGGDTLPEVLTRYTALSGRPALPPAWSYGLWLSTSFTTDYNEETVNEFIDGMFRRDIPLSVFHFDCFWMKEYQWCSFEWDSDCFPDPVGMLRRLKEKGLKICVWINPYIGQKSPLFSEAAEQGYLIRNTSGDVWQWNKWQPGMGIVDFTNPAACAWYQGHLRRMMGEGVDCFKTDFGERIPVDCVYHDGSDPLKMHNYYTQLFNKTVFDVLRAVGGEGEAVLFARSATAGGQQFPVHWGGDCDSNYVAMAESLRGGLSLSACGFGFWSHDIGGFENTATPDVYKRWVAFGLFSSHSRLHGSVSYRVPWLFDDEASDVLRFFTKMKNALMPYIYAQAVHTHRTGIPMMRPMVLAWPRDPVCGYLDMQYMFGEHILVAPVFNGEGTTNAYLPEEDGPWTHLLTGETRAGGHFIPQRHDYFSLGLWVKPNAIIAMGADSTVAYHYAENPVLHVYALTHRAEATVYSGTTGDGEAKISLSLERHNGEIHMTANPSHTGFTLLLHNTALTACPMPWEKTPDGTKVAIPAGCESAVLCI